MQKEEVQPHKETFLVITRDESIFDPSSSSGKFIADIGSVIDELHVIYIGKKRDHPKKINNNTWVYSAQSIPFVSFFSVSRVISSQLIWKRVFRPTTIVSIGDEVKIPGRLSRKYKRPFYVFHSYMKLLGKKEIPLHTILQLHPKKIFVPSAYIGKIIEDSSKYSKKDTQIVILPEFIDVSELQHSLEVNDMPLDNNSNNKIFTLIIFPRHANIYFFSMLKEISKELSLHISRFKFSIVIKPNQYFQARLLQYLFKIPLDISKESDQSINLLRSARLFLYFEPQTSPYRPILYSFIVGCPVISSGDDYSKLILFHSDLEEYSHISRNGKAFGSTVNKFINDPYLYTKYKINCIDFAKTAFTNDKVSYLTELKNGLISKNSIL